MEETFLNSGREAVSAYSFVRGFCWKQEFRSPAVQEHQCLMFLFKMIHVFLLGTALDFRQLKRFAPARPNPASNPGS